MRLVVSVATRNRAQQLLTTMPRHMKCFSLPETLVVVQCDADDVGTLAVLGNLPADPRIKINVQPRDDTNAAKWNRGLTESGDVYLNASDDDVYVTPDTDVKILEAAARF